jgi:hypothetical protein
MMKLGGSMISSFNDIATQAMEMRYQGRNMLGSVWEATANKVQLTRWKNAERQQVLKSIGLHADAMKDELIYRFSADNSMPGRVNRAMRNYFRLNLQSWWTNSSRYSTGMMVSEWLGHTPENHLVMCRKNCAGFSRCMALKKTSGQRSVK